MEKIASLILCMWNVIFLWLLFEKELKQLQFEKLICHGNRHAAIRYSMEKPTKLCVKRKWIKKYYPSGKWRRQRRRQQILNASKNSWHNARCERCTENGKVNDTRMVSMIHVCAHVLLADFYFLSVNWFVASSLAHTSLSVSHATGETAIDSASTSTVRLIVSAECMWLFQM